MSTILKNYISDDDHNKYRSSTQYQEKQCSSVLEGTVKFVGKTDVSKTVIVQTGSGTCMMYQNLKDTSLKEGDSVAKGDIIGTARGNKAEVSTLDRVSRSNWPVYLNGERWYKQDPADTIEASNNDEPDSYLEADQLWINQGVEETDAQAEDDLSITDFDIYNNITKSVQDEFTGNKG